MNNPLLNIVDLPDFPRLQPDQIEPAIRQVLEENRSSLRDLLNRVPENGSIPWDDFALPLQHFQNRLDLVWSPVRHLNSVQNNDEWRTAYNACLPLLSDYATELQQHTGLYELFERLASSAEYAELDPVRKKLVSDNLRDFRIAGVHLPAPEKERLRQIQSRLSELSAKFEENILDATQSWTLLISDPQRLIGLPEFALSMLAQNARQREQEGYLLTLDFPSYHAVLTYADDRDLRETVYQAYVTRASDIGPDQGRYDNSLLMVEILQLRHERARLTGFADHTERSLATKMAETGKEVEHFLLDLAHRARDAALADLDDMASYAESNLGLTHLAHWDYPYVAEKIRADRLGLSQEMLKPYFPADRVVNGLFALVEKLFGVRITADRNISTWHPDVSYYRITDHGGHERAGFYFDLYARVGKRGGAWMDVCRGRFFSPGLQQIPVAYMTANSTPPVGETPALFTHDEVITLFHEFGHGLHHMLTRIDEPELAGISGVEWDAVELPSQFMENWCWEREPLNLLAAHFQTGAPLPEEIFNRMIAARHFQSALQLLRQIEFALFDLRLHSGEPPTDVPGIMAILEQVRDEVAVLKPPAFNRFPQAFSHIFAGGYSAGYYSYKWAEVLSADAFARFEEEGLFSPEVGRTYCEEILEVGASRPAMDSFVAFRGRTPKLDALLRHSGLEAA